MKTHNNNTRNIQTQEKYNATKTGKKQKNNNTNTQTQKIKDKTQYKSTKITQP